MARTKSPAVKSAVVSTDSSDSPDAHCHAAQEQVSIAVGGALLTVQDDKFHVLGRGRGRVVEPSNFEEAWGTGHEEQTADGPAR